MKKILAVLLALAMVLSLAACGGSGEPKKEEPKKEEPAKVTKTADIECDCEFPLYEDDYVTFTVSTEGFEKINSSSCVVIAPTDSYDNFIEARESGYFFQKFETAEQDFEVDFYAEGITEGDWSLYVFDGMSKDDPVIGFIDFPVEAGSYPGGYDYEEDDYGEIPALHDFYSDDKQCVIYMDDAYVVYGLDGNDIVSCTSYMEYDTPELARSAYEQGIDEINNDPDVIDCRLQGNVIVAEYGPGSWEGLNKALLEAVFSGNILK